jgi:hypothetical protein
MESSDETTEPHRPGPSEYDQPAEGGRDIAGLDDEPAGGGDASGGDPAQPEPGTDSRVEDWFGQSVARDAELADELTERLGEERAAEVFEEQASGREEQEARHGDHIDPDGGRSAYRQ